MVLLVLSPAANPSAQAATTIVVQGNRRVEADDIRSRFALGPDHSLDAAAIDTGIKALYATGLFSDVKVARSGEHMVVTVVEAPVIDRVEFEGNHAVKDKQLADEVQSKARAPFNAATVQADVSRIVEIYQRSGRYDVRGEPKTIARDGDRVDLVFEIKEAARPRSARSCFPATRRSQTSVSRRRSRSVRPGC
jgi:outer membrane protein insertion porin family